MTQKQRGSNVTKGSPCALRSIPSSLRHTANLMPADPSFLSQPLGGSSSPSQRPPSDMKLKIRLLSVFLGGYHLEHLNTMSSIIACPEHET